MLKLSRVDVMVEVSGAELGWGSYVPGKPFGGAGEVGLFA